MDTETPTPKSTLDLEMESLQSTKAAYEQSLKALQANHNAAPETVALEKRNLAQVVKRLDLLGKAKSASPVAASPIPSVQ